MLTEKNLSLASKSALKEEQEHYLAIWWEAYRAALSGYDVAEVLSGFGHSKYTGASSPKERADQALADYRAKREEMLK